MELGSNNELSEQIIGAGIRVHKELGLGFLESIYEALAIELRLLRLQFERQKPVPVFYRGHAVGEHRLDLLVEGAVVVELKAVTEFEPIHFAIVRSYLKALGLSDALLLNFAGARLAIKRVGREYSPSPPEEIIL